MAEAKRYQYVETKTWYVDIPADLTGNEPGQDELLIQYVIDEQGQRAEPDDQDTYIEEVKPNLTRAQVVQAYRQRWPAVPGESGLLRYKDRTARPAFRVEDHRHGYLPRLLPENSPGAVE